MTSQATRILSRATAKRPASTTHARAATKPRWVYAFGDLPLVIRRVGTWDAVKGLLGGKGANLAEMTRLALPVPPGFVITTEACNAFLKNGSQFPEGMWEEALRSLQHLEKKTGLRLGDPKRPLLVSCRSGAKFSMPGMMDTVLDIGLDDAVADGLVRSTGDERFVFDAYRRLVQMYGSVVLGIPSERFEALLAGARTRAGVTSDSDLPAEELRGLVRAFKDEVFRATKKPFPEAALDQLRGAVMAVFSSWNGKRAIDYRNASGIPHDLGTAVNIVKMVYGNLGERSGTCVATTRNVTDGEDVPEGDFLMRAQGEDVVSGTRRTRPIADLAIEMPRIHAQLVRHMKRLEKHCRDVQDVEFTIENGVLWMLQTRDAKRTARAAVRIAVDLADARRITRQEAVARVTPEHIETFLHPQLEAKSKRAAIDKGMLLAKGLNVSPGAAIGRIAFDADTAERMAKEGTDPVVLVRAETRPDDVHGMLASAGTVTTRGGRTSHAALVARQFGKPAVVGCQDLVIDAEHKRMQTASGRVLCEGDWISLDGSTGEVFAGKLATFVPDVQDPHLSKLLSWADAIRRLEVWANADYGRDAQRARDFGAQGIGLCRTEHMFFETDRLPVVQKLILAKTDAERREALDKLLPMQRADFAKLFEVMNGLPVTIRLLDPPLHEFLPERDALATEVTDLRARLRLHDGDPAQVQATLREKEAMLESVDALREQNPMLGRRGVRLGIHMPELVRMQVRAIVEAACEAVRKKQRVSPKVMIPLTAISTELETERAVLEDEAKLVMEELGVRVKVQFGTMIEVPRAALVADRIAHHAEFFSFGTNDLTQTTFGISRDDAETGFLVEYLQKGILKTNPFATLDVSGVGGLMRMCVERGRSTREGLHIGICGEHGGDPKSIAFCHEIGLDYVSCSPFRVPVARLAAAHAAMGGRDDQR